MLCLIRYLIRYGRVLEFSCTAATLAAALSTGCGSASSGLGDGTSLGSAGAGGVGGVAGSGGRSTTEAGSGSVSGGTDAGGAAGVGGASWTQGGASSGGAGASAAGGVGGDISGGVGGSAGATGGNAGAAGGKGGASGSAGGAGTAGIAGAGGAASLPKTTLWIAGDSTVMTYPAGNTDGDNGISLEGWGQEIRQFFKSQVTIDNQAIGGRSVAFFMWTVATDSTGAYECDTTGAPQFLMKNGAKVDTTRWATIKSGIKAGDFLLVQFGTNDETHECPRFVSIADFETDFGIMADAVSAKGATAIFVTPQGHRTFTGTKFDNTLLPYANAMKAEAKIKGVEVEDLNLRSGEYYESVGTAFLATNIFDGGTTHFIKAGAIEMATLIVGEVRRNKGPLASYLK